MKKIWSIVSLDYRLIIQGQCENSLNIRFQFSEQFVNLHLPGGCLCGARRYLKSAPAAGIMMEKCREAAALALQAASKSKRKTGREMNARETARKAVEGSIVLLKNDNALLPFAKGIK